MNRIHIILAGIFSLSLSFMSCGNLLDVNSLDNNEIEVSDIAVSTTGTTATISWTTDEATTHVLEYGTVSGTYSTQMPVSVTASTSHSVAISSLTENVKYYYIIKNFHRVLGDTTSDELTFTTTTDTHPTLAEKLSGIWIVGGLSNVGISTTVSDIDLYVPDTDLWYTVTSMPVPVSFAASVIYQGKIYIIGGFDSNGIQSNTVQIYNISTDSWSAGNVAAPFSVRANIQAFLSNGNIFIFGGTTGDAASTWALSSTNQMYSIAANNWTAKTAMTSGSEKYGVVFNDVIFTFGGRTARATTSTVHEGYSIINNAATTQTELAMTAARTGQATAVYIPTNGPAKIISIGGFASLNGTVGCFVFNGTTTSGATPLTQYLNFPFTQTATWTSFTNSYSPSVGFAGSVIIGDNLYIFGGTTSHSTGVQSGANKFDLSGLPGGTWTPIRSMTTPRYGHNALVNNQ